MLFGALVIGSLIVVLSIAERWDYLEAKSKFPNDFK